MASSTSTRAKLADSLARDALGNSARDRRLNRHRPRPFCTCASSVSTPSRPSAKTRTRAETAKIEQEARHRAARAGRRDRQSADRAPPARPLAGARRQDARPDGEDPARPRDGPADRPRAPRLVHTLRQRLPLALLDLLERQVGVALVREANLGRG